MSDSYDSIKREKREESPSGRKRTGRVGWPRWLHAHKYSLHEVHLAKASVLGSSLEGRKGSRGRPSFKCRERGGNTYGRTDGRTDELAFKSVLLDNLLVAAGCAAGSGRLWARGRTDADDVALQGHRTRDRVAFSRGGEGGRRSSRVEEDERADERTGYGNRMKMLQQTELLVRKKTLRLHALTPQSIRA